jgi:histidinol-phosphate aminotransferase
MPMPAAEVVAAVERHGIMIGRLMAPGYERYIRITTGTAEDTDALLAALKDVLGK